MRQLRRCGYLLAGALLGAPACASPEPGGARAREHERVETNARCATCHAEIAAEWETSQHRGSHDALFLTALSREPNRDFCVGCHAPEARNEREATGALGGLGVGCVTCHADVRPGFFGHGGTARAATDCAHCHEFDFPGPRSSPEKMQLTATEHRGSSFAERPCTSCHMPRVEGTHRSHAFVEARSERTLRSALSVAASRPTRTSVRLTLRSHDVGHAYPTGDLFRRLVVEVEALGPDYAVIASERRDLARHFTDTRVPGMPIERRSLRDDRLSPDVPSVLDFELGEAARELPVAWRVRYERVLHMNSHDEARATVESAVTLASGEERAPDLPATAQRPP